MWLNVQNSNDVKCRPFVRMNRKGRRRRARAIGSQPGRPGRPKFAERAAPQSKSAFLIVIMSFMKCNTYRCIFDVNMSFQVIRRGVYADGDALLRAASCARAPQAGGAGRANRATVASSKREGIVVIRVGTLREKRRVKKRLGRTSEERDGRRVNAHSNPNSGGVASTLARSESRM